MTPRERAEALGWVTDGLLWVDRDYRPVACSARNPAGWWWCGSLLCATEDEALEHALLFLDVWLS